MSVAERMRTLGLHDYCDAHVEMMRTVVDALQPTHIFEWGTSWGESARIWYELTAESAPHCEIHTTGRARIGDPCGEHPGFTHGHWLPDSPRIHTHHGDGLDVSDELAHTLQPKRALFYLDDDHQYEATARTLIRLRNRRPDAVIVIHDTGWGEPRAALDRFLAVHGDHYDVAETREATGMTRLWPRR